MRVVESDITFFKSFLWLLVENCNKEDQLEVYCHSPDKDGGAVYQGHGGRNAESDRIWNVY